MIYKPGDELEVKIEKIVPRGLGMAFAEKLTVFAPLVAVGDRVRVRLKDVKKRIGFAEVQTLMEPSGLRVKPPCPYFGTCGGCDFQQMTYEAQIQAKLGIVRDCLHRIGKIEYDSDIDIIPSPKPFEYRSRAQWHIDTQAHKIGYFKRGSHDVIDVKQCPILVTELQETLAELRDTIEWDSFLDQLVTVEAASGDGGEVSIYGEELIEPTDEIFFSTASERYLYSAHSFFQGNQLLVEELIETALGNAKGERALDLYCGVGLFSLPLARRFSEVIGVEGNDAAVKLAEKNAVNAGLENIIFESAGVGVYLNETRPKNVDFVLLDPPRAGTERGVIETIIKMKPKTISYVSCEPSILARDLRVFLDAGYKIESLTALDLFPQTHHVETIARLILI